MTRSELIAEGRRLHTKHGFLRDEVALINWLADQAILAGKGCSPGYLRLKPEAVAPAKQRIEAIE